MFDKEEDIPGFVVITAADLQTNFEQGANTSNIVDATVFANSVFVGTFELPATIPIMQTGPVELQIAAGIKNNGLVNDRLIYPFYDFFTMDTLIHAEEHFYLQPLVKYFPKTVFDNPWSGEDFESGINFDTNPNSDTVFIRETDKSKVFKGNASGSF